MAHSQCQHPPTIPAQPLQGLVLDEHHQNQASPFPPLWVYGTTQKGRHLKKVYQHLPHQKAVQGTRAQALAGLLPGSVCLLLQTLTRMTAASPQLTQPAARGIHKPVTLQVGWSGPGTR